MRLFGVGRARGMSWAAGAVWQCAVVQGCVAGALGLVPTWRTSCTAGSCLPAAGGCSAACYACGDPPQCVVCDLWLACWLCHELNSAMVASAAAEQLRKAVCAALVSISVGVKKVPDLCQVECVSFM